MNRQISHLFVLVLVLFGLLVVYTSRWTVFEAKSLQHESANRRPLLEEQRIPRGYIYADDGTVLARDVREGHGSTLRYVRTYPQNGLFAHAVGYSYITRGDAGLEREENDNLAGRHNEFTSLIDEITNTKKVGDDLRTTLDPAAQRTAIAGLAGRAGSVVAIEPDTGKVRALVSVPGYNPNNIPNGLPPGQSLFDRATQGRYPPGSTMKVLTAVAAIDSGRYTPDSIVSGKSPKIINGVPLSNCCTEGSGSYGPLTLTEALAKSVNTVYGEVGEKLGNDLMFKYMDRFGFNKNPPIQLPPQETTPSGVYGKRGLLGPNNAIDIGRVAIGQERLQVTPLQMALIAATVANGGKLMKAELVDKVVSPDGRVRETVQPDQIRRVMKPDTAAKVTAMMEGVVKSGTGVAAQIPGITVAGKTGTAEVANGTSNQAWFICFAPVPNPKIAIAVTVERTQGEGGTVAAPIAKQVMQVLLNEHR